MAKVNIDTSGSNGVGLYIPPSKSNKSGNSALTSAVTSALQAANNQYPNAAAQAAYEMVQVPAGRAPLFPVSSELQSQYSTQYKADNNSDYAGALADPVGALYGTATGSAVNQTATTGSGAGNVVASGSNPVYTGNGTITDIPDYLWADLAKYYGMDTSTAYQEALANTSYQRAVADLQAAGLNPMLAAGGSGASGVYGASPLASGSYGGSSGKGAHQWYNIFSNLGTAIGGVVGKGYVGAKAGQAIGSLIGNYLDGQYKF